METRVLQSLAAGVRRGLVSYPARCVAGGAAVTGRYGGEHQALRRAGLPFAYGQLCGRCGRPMLPGQSLDLDHRDHGAGWRGFAHSHCNRSAGARLGNARRARREGKRKMLTTCALGIEIAEDRSHTSIAAAGYLDGDVVLIELSAYLEGTDPTAAVLRLQAERTVTAVVVDPRSPAATTIKLLTDAHVRVT